MKLDLKIFDRKSDFIEQRKLFSLSFPENSGTSVCSDAHYKWKFDQFPGQVSSYQYVAYENSNLLGYYAALPYTYKIGNRYYICGMVCDVMTHTAARGKGVFTKIGWFATEDLKKRGLGFTSGYPIRPEVIPGHLKVGWKKVLKMPMYIKVLGTKTLLPKKIHKLSFLLNPVIQAISKIPYLFARKYIVEISDTNIFKTNEQEINQFLLLWQSEQKNALNKTCSFLQWRTSAPTSQYYVFQAKCTRENKIVGMAIARPMNLKGVEVLAIIDIMILDTHYSSSISIINCISELAQSIKKDAIVCMATKIWAKKYFFFRNLLMPTPVIFTLILKKLNEEISDSDLFNEENWHLFWIDSDDL